ncbi:hypothetical protein HMI54_010124 [Coelomomyces lativittatus]|nr:hypothetical protein HMI54_010124 [Coelomomyces lativittatus]KAJ1517605.1 hypothetical protein HMI55_006560 [Coelomomyces lativittatus]
MPWCTLHAFLYAFNCVNPLLDGLAFFSVHDPMVFPTISPLRKLTCLSMHISGASVMVLEILGGAMEIRIWTVVPYLGIMMLYFCWTFIYHAITHKFVYPFMDYQHPNAAWMYPIMMVLPFVSFMVIFLFHKLKRTFVSRPEWLIVQRKESQRRRALEDADSTKENDDEAPYSFF